jgi:hypothetical protein
MTKLWQKKNKNIDNNSGTSKTTTSRKIKKKKKNNNNNPQQLQQQLEQQQLNNNNNNKGGIPKPNAILSLEKTLIILKKHCQIRNNIFDCLEKRQKLKPWIMVLLLHRYDRGIRNINELNTDSIYYNTNIDNNNNANDKTSFDGSESIVDIDIDIDIDTATATATKSNSIDLRYALTPSEKDIEDYNANKEETNTNDSNSSNSTSIINEIIIQQKLMYLATEARRIIIDRDIPFNRITNLNELQSRRLSKTQPDVFLSLFSRCFCLTENNPIIITKKNNQSINNGSDGEGDGTATKNNNNSNIVKDFSNRRYNPPSLKASSLSKKKKELLKIEKDKILNTNKMKNMKMQMQLKRISPEIQKKLRAMNNNR